MLSGEYRYVMDAKKRIFIPAKMREELGTSFMIVRDVRAPRLKIFSMEEWDKYTAPLERLDRELQEEVMRFFHRDGLQAEPDAQGRVVLTPSLVEYAQLEKDIIIVGCKSCAEIWSQEMYDAQRAAEDPEALRKKLLAFGL